MVKNVSVVLVIEGGSGTKEEEMFAREHNIPVIPIAITGGSALEIWEDQAKRINDIVVAGQPIDKTLFAALNDPNSHIAVDAAITLILKIMQITPVY